MAQTLQCVEPEGVITGWDFSTGAVKCLAFNLEGRVLEEIRPLPTDVWTGDPSAEDAEEVAELNVMQLEGQARASARAMVARLREANRLKHWLAGGISATHHTAGRIDRNLVPLRRAICWNDQTLARYREQGEARLGGRARVKELIGGPWADRYSLSHLVKDEDPNYLDPEDWRRTHRILPHGPLAAGYLTGNFDVTSVSSAASTGIMDLRTCQWCREMLGALASKEHQDLAWKQLPEIIDHYQPIGRLADSLALEVGIALGEGPLVFPTSDDQQAGLVGGGAVDDGQVAVILGNSAVVNSSSKRLPDGDALDVMRLNWGPYLWMRCYTNGAQFLDTVVGDDPDWAELERLGRQCPVGAGGTLVLPFIKSEPSLGITRDPEPEWFPTRPQSLGERYRAALEAIAYMICLGVDAHRQAGQEITRITVSGGIARSDLMCEILASVLRCRLERLESDEGPALGAAVTALGALESNRRRKRGIREPFTVADAVAILVKYADPVDPNPAWTGVYQEGLKSFLDRLHQLQRKQAGEASSP
ncbi:MAG: xylulose kinase [Planctomycetes bacterium RBG_16_64_12]|nr:MAG: xylulose kinase [Planctomycetes bacterium RBG_16_64_12]